MVVGEVINGVEGVDVVKEIVFDVVFMDVQMFVMDGVVVIVKICEFSDVKVVIFIIFDWDDYFFDVFDVGVSGFMFKNVDVELFVVGLCQVVDGYVLLVFEVIW